MEAKFVVVDRWLHELRKIRQKWWLSLDLIDYENINMLIFNFTCCKKKSVSLLSRFEKLVILLAWHTLFERVFALTQYFAQSAGAIEYTDCFSAEGVRSPPNECPGYDTKQSDGEVPAVLELWGMWSTPSLPLLPGPLWPGVVAPDWAPIYGLNRTNSILILKWIVWLNWIAWNRNVFDNWTVLTFKLRAYA